MKNDARYNNYHKHDHYSNIRTPDVIVKPEDYMRRAVELGHTTYFTTNHGCSSNPLEAYDLCKKYNLKMIYGMEMYYSDDRFIKEGRNNSHIIVIGLTKNAYYHINRISSEANKTGFYYHPRVDMELLLSLPPKEVVITTACIGGRLFKTEDYIDVFVNPLKSHFGDNFMLEVQDHEHEYQESWNKKVLELSSLLDIPIIHGCDSHYIYKEDVDMRTKFLKGKGMDYGSEDEFILDYPERASIVNNYKRQGILTDEQVDIALNNTLVFDKAEDLAFNKEIKMPTIYPNQDKNKVLRKIIADKWNIEKKTIDVSLHDKYKEEIYSEVDIIEKTNMADYFLLNEKIINKAVNEYGGVLTRTGRGSAPSYFVNKLLGFTDIDRISAKVPLYSTRFMTVSRILETGSLPDIDFNFAEIEPAIRASKDILGEDGVYFMVAFGTMQDSAAFRNLCRAYKFDMEKEKQLDENGKVIDNEFNKKLDLKIGEFNKDTNNVAKNLDLYRNDKKWKGLIEESKSFIGVIDSIAPSPCSFLLLNEPISKEVGLIRVGDEICAFIDGYTADKWKYLKNDLLTVGVWDIISKTFELIDRPIPTIKELDDLLEDNVWDLYANGITSTLNQVDSDFATNLVKKYRPTSIAEMSAFVAAIRPGFASLLNHFINREEYTTHVPALDEVLEDSFHYMLYQESIMKMLIWCGIEEDQTYDIIKKIAKKVFDEQELAEFKLKLMEGFKKQTGSTEWFSDVWQVVEDAVEYSFNASHSLSVSYDSLYGAYLKAKHPLEYYKVVLDHYKDDKNRTTRLIGELSYFDITLNGIKFRYSTAGHTIDKENKAIYKGIASIKYISENLADELYELRNNKYETFVDLLIDIKEKTSCNTRQLSILIKLDFFSEFGKAKKLLDIVELHDYIGKNRISIVKAEESPFTLEQFEKYSARKTPKTYMEVDFNAMVREVVKNIPNTDISISDKVEAQFENLGYIDLKLGVDGKNCYVTEVNTKYTPKIKVVSLNDGRPLEFKIKKDYYAMLKIKVGDIIYIHQAKKVPRWRKSGEHKNGKPKFEIIPNSFEWEIENCERILEEDIYIDRSDESA